MRLIDLGGLGARLENNGLISSYLSISLLVDKTARARRYVHSAVPKVLLASRAFIEKDRAQTAGRRAQVISTRGRLRPVFLEWMLQGEDLTLQVA